MAACSREINVTAANYHRLPDPLMPEPDAAAFLGVRPRWLQIDRFGPKRVPFVRLGRRTIRYRRSDLEAYVVSRTVAAQQQI